MTQWLIRHFIPQAEDTAAQSVRTAYGTLGSAVGIAANVLLALLKALAGMLTGSLAVTADAVNNLSDAAGSVMSLISVRMAQKPHDADHPFGHGRMEYLGALGVGVLILVMGVELFKEGVSSILSPQAIAFTWLSAAILAGSIALKLWLWRFFTHTGSAIDSETLKAAGQDSFSDALATGAVLLSMLAFRVFGLKADGWMGLIVALIVLKAGYSVCRDTVDRLLGGKPDKELGDQLVQKLLSYPEVLGVHDLVIHDYGPGRCVASVHAEISDQSDLVAIHEVIDRAEREISQELHLPICIHMDPIVTDDPETNRVARQMADYLAGVDSRLKLHDFRRVRGENQINLIFDVVLPADFGDSRQLEAGIRAHAKVLDPRHECVLHFDIDLF